jgi:hypothetical protein
VAGATTGAGSARGAKAGEGRRTGEGETGMPRRFCAMGGSSGSGRTLHCLCSLCSIVHFNRLFQSFIHSFIQWCSFQWSFTSIFGV